MAGVLHVVRLHEVRQSSKENGRTDPEGGAETQGGGEANSALVSSPLLIPTHTHTHTHTPNTLIDQDKPCGGAMSMGYLPQSFIPGNCAHPEGAGAANAPPTASTASTDIIPTRLLM
jgi:hypothetical protein